MKILFRMMLIHRENGKMFHCKDYNFEILFNKTSMFQDPVALFTEKSFLRIHSEKRCGSSLYHSIYTLFLLKY